MTPQRKHSPAAIAELSALRTLRGDVRSAGTTDLHDLAGMIGDEIDKAVWALRKRLKLSANASMTVDTARILATITIWDPHVEASVMADPTSAGTKKRGKRGRDKQSPRRRAQGARRRQNRDQLSTKPKL